jgi:hypothetical protein
MDIGHIGDVGEEHIGLDEIKREEQDEEEGDESDETNQRDNDSADSEDPGDLDYLPEFDLTKSKQSRIEAIEDNVKVEVEDQVFAQSIQAVQAAKRKRTTIDLTGDSDDDIAVIKKVRVPSLKVCHLCYRIAAPNLGSI